MLLVFLMPSVILINIFKYIPGSHQEVEYCPAPGFVQTPDHWWCTGDERVWRRNWRTLRPLCSETAPSHTDLWVQPQQEPNICGLILKKKKQRCEGAVSVPVLRLQSQASASARSCLIGPSHDGLSCRNIHCRTNVFTVSLSLRTEIEPWRLKCVHLLQCSVNIHLHLHDEQVWGLNELLHHLWPVNPEHTHTHSDFFFFFFSTDRSFHTEELMLWI